jgi:hypothetical protein
MNNLKPTSSAALLAATLILSAAAPASFAQFAERHPRRAQVLQRDAAINNRINNNYGNLGGNYGNLEHQDQSIKQQQRADAAANGGYITQGQQGQLNREENALSAETKYSNQNNAFVQNHPLRSQVLKRDANLNYSLNKDEGHLGGNYSTIQSEDKSIAQQEQQDAAQNGGHITRTEQQQLNQEETGVRNQIKQDYNPNQ